ncbi:MAG: hypothetical protein Tsb0019_00830 [Roseibium sp.]
MDIASESFAGRDRLIEDASERLPGLHRRRLVHHPLRDKPAAEWEHFETSPEAGGPRVRLRLLRAGRPVPDAPDETGILEGFGAQLETLRTRMERQIDGGH